MAARRLLGPEGPPSRNYDHEPVRLKPLECPLDHAGADAVVLAERGYRRHRLARLPFIRGDALTQVALDSLTWPLPRMDVTVITVEPPTPGAAGCGPQHDTIVLCLGHLAPRSYRRHLPHSCNSPGSRPA